MDSLGPSATVAFSFLKGISLKDRASPLGDVDEAEDPGLSDWALEISIATVRVLSRRLGTSFAAEVRAEIASKADRLAARGEAGDEAQAEDIRSLTLEPFWDQLTTR
jgi:regulator of protease activity HflC (stomatin/prohibitin superfamily)